VEESVTKPDVWSARLASAWIFWPICLAGVALVGLSLIGPEVERRLGIDGQCEAMQAEVDALKQTRDELSAAATALENDPTYLEHQVRRELGIVRPGEIRMSQGTPLPTPPTPAPSPEFTATPAVRAVAMFGDPHLRFISIVAGATLLAVGILFSLPGRQTVQSSKFKVQS
jgi:anti-sigma factor RsiW